MFTAWIPAFAGMTAMLFSSAGVIHAEDALVAQGKAVFTAQCARCHGPEGKGDGLDAKRLVVAPRDLTSGKFKFKSTAWGTPPSDEDIARGIIGHGLAGSGMPSFSNLSENVRANLVAYIKTISPAFQSGLKPEPIPPPANRGAKPDLEKGKDVFTKMQCGSCHGPNGRANGTSAFTLKDAWDKPIKVANLTQGWTYRGGSRPIDIYHRILAGIEGAPMPSYEGAASHEDIWQMCNYVATLQLKTNWAFDINALRVNGELPLKTDDPLWQKAARTDVNMQSTVYQNDRRAPLTVNAVSVQALYNGDSVAFRITWDDPVENAKGTPDALLMALKPADYAGDPRGNLHTLYDNDAPPLDMMLWQATAPKTVGQRKTTLAHAVQSGWTPRKSLESSALFDDGRWTLVLVRPLAMEGAETLTSGEARTVGFAVADGQNNETGLKRSMSQWVRLVLGDSKAHD